MKELKNLSIEKIDGKLVFSVNGDKIDTTNIVSVNIYMEMGLLEIETKKVERMEL